MKNRCSPSFGSRSRFQLGFGRLARSICRRFVPPFALCAWVFTATLIVATPASAASLQGPISGWEQGSEPSWVSMHVYVPDNLAPNPPILVIVHYCSGNAAGVFGQAQSGGIVAAADEQGFILVLPQTSQNCWDVATAPTLTNGGGGDTLAMVHQVEFAIATYGANPDRVYIMGTSSGAMATQAMVAVYPDVFKAGVAFAGVPAGCWAVNNPDGQWSSPCANGEVTHTAEEWGDMVRNMYPGYTGFRPRLQIWHGDADSTISPVNQTEAVKEWTNVLGLDIDAAVTTTESVSGSDYSRQQWMDSCSNSVLDIWTQLGGPHGTGANMNGAHTLPFMALDQAGDTDPQADCGSETGTGGVSGAGGADGNAGGSDAGVGGAGVGGAGTDAGGSDAGGTAGIETGGGSDMGDGGGGVGVGGTGTGGGDTMAGGTAGIAAGGTVASGAGGTTGAPAPNTSNQESSGCSWDRSNRSRPVHGFVLAGLLALMFVRRRHRHT